MSNNNQLKSVTQCAERLINIMESGKNPWVKPWKSSNNVFNPVSKKPFTGFNRFFLNLMNTYTTGYFVTYKQCESVGGQVKKGEKGFPVILPLIFEKENSKGDKELVCGGFKEYYVFNLDQCENVSQLYPELVKNDSKRSIKCEETLRMSGATINHVSGNGCYYSPLTDNIVLEPFENFINSDLYYATAFHELSHWTGHESRLDRLQDRSKEAYAFEELIAELSANFLCNVHEIDSIDTHNAAYLTSWIKALKEDSSVILKACGKAQKACDFILKNVA